VHQTLNTDLPSQHLLTGRELAANPAIFTGKMMEPEDLGAVPLMLQAQLLANLLAGFHLVMEMTVPCYPGFNIEKTMLQMTVSGCSVKQMGQKNGSKR